jgi:hypothetical protein
LFFKKPLIESNSERIPRPPQAGIGISERIRSKTTSLRIGASLRRRGLWRASKSKFLAIPSEEKRRLKFKRWNSFLEKKQKPAASRYPNEPLEK